MLRSLFSPVLSLVLFLTLAWPVQADDDVLSDSTVLAHLEQTIAWQQDVVLLSPVQMNAREVVLKASLQKNAARTLQHAFAYARAYATFADADTDAAGSQLDKDDRARMAAAAVETKQNIERATGGLAQINAQLRHANNKTRPALLLQKTRLEGLLRFSKARQEMLNNANKLFLTHNGDETEDLMGRITNLSRSVPGVDTKAPKPGTDKTPTNSSKDTGIVATLLPGLPAAATTSTAAPTDAQTSAAPTPGIVGLLSSILAISQKQQDVSELLSETRALNDRNASTSVALRDQLRATVARGNDLTKQDAANQTVESLQAGVDSEIKNLQNTSSVLLPLAQMSVWLNTSLRNLEEWNGLLGDEMASRLRQLGVKLGFLFVALLIPFGISELVRRASTRYVSDARLHRQLRTVRRALLGLVVFLILLLNFVSEFGAFATFAGFLTAGLAVALQNILLSMVAHFFFFGRYGVRSGDRVTVSGTTGEMLQIGITRFYLRELEMEDGELKPNGKIVAFPNSILFQPTAFSKHVHQG